MPSAFGILQAFHMQIKDCGTQCLQTGLTLHSKLQDAVMGLYFLHKIENCRYGQAEYIKRTGKFQQKRNRLLSSNQSRGGTSSDFQHPSVLIPDRTSFQSDSLPDMTCRGQLGASCHRLPWSGREHDIGSDFCLEMIQRVGLVPKKQLGQTGQAALQFLC